MRKEVNFWPKAIGLSIPLENSALRDILIIKLSPEELQKLKDMPEFSLTRLNYGSRDLILGNQSNYVIVKLVESQLMPNASIDEIFAQYREHNFDRSNPEHEFLG